MGYISSRTIHGSFETMVEGTYGHSFLLKGLLVFFLLPKGTVTELLSSSESLLDLSSNPLLDLSSFSDSLKDLSSNTLLDSLALFDNDDSGC